MRVIKNINNNVSICLDSTGKEVFVFGKGVGFHKPPYDLSLAEIERTYYDVDSTYVNMIQDIPEDVLEISDEIINYARMKINKEFSGNIVFTLADHIAFTIRRHQENIKVNLPIVHDIENLFEKEMDVGLYGIRLIRKKMNVYLPREEAAYIALHLINSEAQLTNEEENSEKVIEDIMKIVEESYQMELNRHDFSYSRFVSHMHYLLKRGKGNTQMQTENGELYRQLVKEYPKAYETAEEIGRYLEKAEQLKLNEEEKMYLMIHINRLCTREDCYL